MAFLFKMCLKPMQAKKFDFLSANLSWALLTSCDRVLNRLKGEDILRVITSQHFQYYFAVGSFKCLL